ncbi:hypothetical protein V8E51_015805 [Hyaloscypha variabilis]
MATKFGTFIFSLFFLVRLGMGEVQFAQPAPQLLHDRQSFIGGISLYATTPETGEDGVCPSYTQTCPDSCCPDGCCPMGTYCFVNGDYCCPTDSDCSSLVDSTPSCANSTWVMYTRPAGAVSPYFCCEPDQIALAPNLCVPNNVTYAASLLAPLATQTPGSSPSGATTASGKSSTSSRSGASPTGSTTSKASGTSSIASGTPSLIETGTTAPGKETTTQSPTGTVPASPTVTPKAGAAGRLLSGNWPWGVAVLVITLGFGMRLVL